MCEVGREYTLEIRDIALPSGFGVARAGGLVVFVGGAVTGDRVKARIVKRDKRYCHAALIEVVEASPHRTVPRCRDFGECGGCDLQVLGYEKQLEIKQNHLHQVLRRIGGADLGTVRVSPIVPSADRFFYRSKIEFAFGQKDQEVLLGLHQRVSALHADAGRIIEVDDCCLFSPVAARILSMVRAWVKASGLEAYDPDTGKGALRRLVVREAKASGQVMINVVSHLDITPWLKGLAEILEQTFPKIASFYATVGDRPILLYGKTYIEERISDLTYRVYPFSFFQPNPRTAEELYKRIIPVAAIDGNERAVGLYCGSGAIELFLSRFVREVKGFDSSAGNISCAKENSSINDVENCLFVQEKVEHISRKGSMASPDILVIDPPRRGMSREAQDVVKAMGARKMIYISCNPSTLARDVKALATGYVLREVIPFDFFPHTAHFEVLGLFERK